MSVATPSNVVVTTNSPRLTDTVSSTFGPATNPAQFYRLSVTNSGF